MLIEFQEIRMTPHWHTQSVDAVLKKWSTSESGLSAAAAAERLQTHGPNELRERRGRGSLRMLREQLTETMVLILIVAGVISAFLGKGTETAAILAIVALFALLGFIQEYRAERAMAALQQLAVPAVRVRRNGAVSEIPARDLVPGDIVLLEAGNAVPADLRLVEVAQLKIQEAALTGESEPIEKNAEAIPDAQLSLGDRRNMAYLGTAAAYGRGRGVVVATGTLTENRMTVTVVDAAGERLDLMEPLRRQRPSLTTDECRTATAWDVPLPIRLALVAGALCNDAVLQSDAGPECFSAIGDPTEGALLVAAARTGLFPERLQAAAPRVAEVPFDSNRKRMTTVHRLADGVPDAWLPFSGSEHVAFIKGAADGLLALSAQVWD
jgi:magnesium-transporting ATPase (P-type)